MKMIPDTKCYVFTVTVISEKKPMNTVKLKLFVNNLSFFGDGSAELQELRRNGLCVIGSEIVIGVTSGADNV